MATNPMKPPQNMPMQDAETPADAAAPGEEADTGVELCIKIADDGTLDPDNDGVARGAVLACRERTWPMAVQQGNFVAPNATPTRRNQLKKAAMWVNETVGKETFYL